MSTITVAAKSCIVCGEPIRGRADKKYCGDDCRSVYNNKRNRDKNNLMRRVNRILRNNREVLHQFYVNNRRKVTKQKLLESGYKFTYFTNTFTTQKGSTYLFCYEHGLLELKDQYYAIVLRKNYVD